MPRQLRIIHFVLLLFIFSCQATPIPAPQSTLLIYRFTPPAFVEYSSDFQKINEIPFAIPPSCGLYNTFSAPIGRFIVIELSCPNGQAVLYLDVETGAAIQPVTYSDAHFLAWTHNGNAAYLRVDSLGSPRIIRADVDGKQDEIPITEYTYDLSTHPTTEDFTFTFSRGLGYGSEIHLAQNNGRTISSSSEAEWTSSLYVDQYNYLSFARWSPDGSQIAFIKVPDTQTPFTVGELWVIPSTTDFTTNTPVSAQMGKFLAYADAGHGYAANWSPDGKQIAFVMRENPEDENANQVSDALISNIYIVDVQSGEWTQITHLTEGRAETPFWSPDGNTLAFNVVVNGRMNVSIADAATGEIQILETESICCPAWMRK